MLQNVTQFFHFLLNHLNMQKPSWLAGHTSEQAGWALWAVLSPVEDAGMSPGGVRWARLQKLQEQEASVGDTEVNPRTMDGARDRGVTRWTEGAGRAQKKTKEFEDCTSFLLLL